MKLKLLSGILCVSAAVLFCGGCGKTETGNTIKIGVSIPAADHGWTGGIVWWAEQAKKEWEAKDPGVKVIISTAKDAAEQVDKIENLLVQNVDALVVLPQEPGPLTGICSSAAKQGRYLVVVDRGLRQGRRRRGHQTAWRERRHSDHGRHSLSGEHRPCGSVQGGDPEASGHEDPGVAVCVLGYGERTQTYGELSSEIPED